jgi:hypothetical protein
VLDHVFLGIVTTVRRSLDAALLVRHATEEQLAHDLLLGDLTWETSCTLPGEGTPPRVQAEVTLDWPTWSQATYRSWLMGDEIEAPEDGPVVHVDVVVRVQHLAAPPDLASVLAALPDEGPALTEPLVRAAPVVEHIYETDGATEVAMELAYNGLYEISESTLHDAEQVQWNWSRLGPWVASALVRLADLDLGWLPPDP